MFSSDLFEGKRVLISGGGSGIGYCMTRAFLEHGASVMIASRNEERLQKASKTLSEFGPCCFEVVDIRNSGQVEKLADAVADQLGGLDILLNNAGGQFPSPAEKISDKGWQAVVEINLNGTWYMSRTMFNHFFAENKNGIILNIIANMFRGFPGMAHTGAARAGVQNLTRTLAVEWARKGVRINAIAPGVIKSSGLEQYPKHLLKGMADRVPMQRLGSTTDIATAALFLCSEGASYITGDTLYIDGGQKLWGDIWELPSISEDKGESS